AKVTQVGRALARLGIEHIVSFSPQARGRSERMNRTLQGRLVNELRVAQIRTLEAANRYLRQRFVPTLNATFGRAPADHHAVSRGPAGYPGGCSVFSYCQSAPLHGLSSTSRTVASSC